MSETDVIGDFPSLEELRDRFHSAETYYIQGLVVSEIRRCYLSERDATLVNWFGELATAPYVHPRRQEAKALVSELCEEAQGQRWMSCKSNATEVLHFKQRLAASID